MPLTDAQVGPAIQDAGYKYISGYGPKAIWQRGTWDGPDKSHFTPAEGKYAGESVEPETQEVIANRLFPSSSPYIAANNKPDTQATNAPDSMYDQNGKYYERQNGQWVANPQFDNPTKAAGYRAPTAGPAPKTALDIEQQQGQIAANNQSIVASQATITRNAQLDALAAQQQAFLQQKATLAQQNDDKRLALETNTQIATIQNQRDTYAFNIAQAQQRSYEAQTQAQFDAGKFNASGATSAAEFNATGQQRASEFNATQGLATEQANNQAEAQKRRDLADANTALGTLAQDTGNRGRFATFATANRGFGQDNTAIGQGTSLIDNTSVGPLEQGITSKNALQATPDRPYTFNPVTFSPIAFNPVAAPQFGGGPLSTFTPPSQATPTPAAQPALDASGRTQTTITNDNNQTRAIAAALGLPAAEHGGMMRGAYMSGDSTDGKENAEINIPLGGAGAMVISTKGMKPAQIKALKAKMQKFATGGLFDQLGDSPLSKQFLEDSSAKFREGTPWANKPGALPSPVYQSSPGFNPQLASLLNAGRALEQGVPTEFSSWLASRYALDTISGPRIVSRTA